MGSVKDLAIIKTNNLPIRHEGDVHDGKVRSVYWLTKEDSKKVSQDYGTNSKDLGVMVISDRISAFECIWESQGGLKGIPGKGASLNAISKYWFEQFEKEGLAGNHIIDSPHPLVWIVEKTKPVMIEAIARQYITGSMWRDYDEKGVRNFCGISLPESLQKNQRLESLLITPSTKGVINGIPNFSESEGQPGYNKDDVNISRQLILDNYKRFGFKSQEDILQYEKLLREGFELIGKKLDSIDKIFVDTKFEFGYGLDDSGNSVLKYIDEIGTPDSSRYWDKKSYIQNGLAEEESKEKFRQDLLNNVPDRDVLLNKNRMDERKNLAATYKVPDRVFMETSNLYLKLAEQITGKPLPQIGNAREEIIESLKPYGLIE
jgi:phosphoribosylaminoimidazole-succinocarboxamide synthase